MFLMAFVESEDDMKQVEGTLSNLPLFTSTHLTKTSVNLLLADFPSSSAAFILRQEILRVVQKHFLCFTLKVIGCFFKL